ncbi:aldehyde dehydrogenase family protein [Candidatus Woesearchaeota archaeon]|nr:aldehyde dehydrogenase family protein [Candidatus Woesearchaeota archaeon]
MSGELILGNFVNGEFVTPKNNLVFKSLNPSNIEECLGEFLATPEEEITDVVSSAKKAQLLWSKKSQPERAEYILKLAKILDNETVVTHLATVMAKECGKPFIECVGEVVEARHMCEHMAGYSRQHYGYMFPSQVDTRESEVLEIPKGVMACITPWNYPMAIPVWHMMPSVLKGNTVILKPSEETPLCAQEIFKYIQKANFPPGVINMIQGGKTTGKFLVENNVDAIIFTGSTNVAQKIQAIAIQKGKTVACETGGKNAMIVCDDANLELAIESTALSICKTTGQRCVSAERVIVMENIYDSFKKGLVEKIKSFKIGDPFEKEVLMGPLINQNAVDKVTKYNDLARSEGRVLLNGERVGNSKGYFISTMLYEMDAEQQRFHNLLNEEVFGPHAAIIKVKNLEEAIKIHNDTDFGLSAGYLTTNIDTARILEKELKVGVGYLNGPCIGAEVQLPFGGLKLSGNGNPSGGYLLNFVVHHVARTRCYGSKIKTAYGIEDPKKG